MSGAFEWLRRPWKPVASEGGIIRVARGVLEAVVERETGKEWSTWPRRRKNGDL